MFLLTVHPPPCSYNKYIVSIQGEHTCFSSSQSGLAQSQFGSFFSSPCQQTSVTIPSVTPEWTCGLNLSGTFNCSSKHCNDMSSALKLYELKPPLSHP